MGEWIGKYFVNLNVDRPELKKTYHESTEIRRHEILAMFLFRAFGLSCFRDQLFDFVQQEIAMSLFRH
jgi:hypothetical protein